MEHDYQRRDVPRLGELADRMTALAETAELMDDADGAADWRQRAADLRMIAMRLLDD